MSDGVYCAYTPNFYKEYGLEALGVSMTGKEVLLQSLREKCLHKIMTEKYKDEGSMFFTFFSYVGNCFAHDSVILNAKTPNSLDACYDWSTVLIEGNEEVDYLN